jgi:hypothetical protein
MAGYITAVDENVALNRAIPFDVVSIPCNSGNVIPVATGSLTLRGNTCNRFARYRVTLQANVAIPEGGEVTAVALAITLNGADIPESVAIFTPQAVEEYGHINTSVIVTVPSGCCVTVAGAYVDGTEDVAAVVPTPSITVRRNASLTVERIA